MANGPEKFIDEFAIRTQPSIKQNEQQDDEADND
jgi:hypothetical protein